VFLNQQRFKNLQPSPIVVTANDLRVVKVNSTSQPRSSGWLSQPWGHWQWQQLATAADSWIFI